MARTKADPTAWRSTPKGIADYQATRADAQARANAAGHDWGLEANDLYRNWTSFRLPCRQNRAGHELRCEVVSPENIATTQPGHGHR